MKHSLLFVAAVGGLFTFVSAAVGGPFASSDMVTSFNGASFIAIGDLNGDGKPDLVSVDDSSTITVATNAGNGIFLISRTYNVGNASEPVSVAIADINGDGKPDIITANYANNTVTIFTNAGSGSFVSNASYTVGAGPSYVAAQDINGDGKPDIITANNTDKTLTILTNAGGTFPVSHTIPGVYSFNSGPYYSPQVFAVADINGDGKRDLIAATANGFEVLTNAGGGNFATNAVFSFGYPAQALVAADFNKDGKMDVAALVANQVMVFTNGANGVLTMSQTINLPALAGPAPVFPSYPAGSYPFPQIVAADVDGDSYTDLVVVANIGAGNLNINDLEILFNNGSGGTFSTNALTAGAPGALGITNSTGMYIPATVGYSFSFAIADLNGDGKPDFVGAEPGNGSAPGGFLVMTNDISNVISLAVPTNIVVTVGSNGFAVLNLPSIWTNWTGTLPTVNTPFPLGYPFSPQSTNVITSSASYHITSALSASTNDTITVIVLDFPVFTLFGSNPLTNFVDTYVEPGAIAMDAAYGYLPVYVSGNLVTNVPGTYTVTYTATNYFGNVGVTNRTVVIVPTPTMGIASAVGDQAALFWPASGATNYVVQMTTNLTSGNWVDVPANNVLMGIFVTNSAPAAFFRFVPQ